MANSQPAPVSGNVINQILYPEIHENNSRHVDKNIVPPVLGTITKYWLCVLEADTTTILSLHGLKLSFNFGSRYCHHMKQV